MAKKRDARRQAASVAGAVEPRPAGASFFQVCLTVALLAVYAGFLAHPLELTTTDLGRYLKNGELFFQHGLIANTNLFAYTTPDHPSSTIPGAAVRSTISSNVRWAFPGYRCFFSLSV